MNYTYFQRIKDSAYTHSRKKSWKKSD